MFAVGLVHWPIKDRAGNIVATNITHFDIHDIARACRTYGVDRYFIIHPHAEQQMYVARILEHWRIGDGAKYNPMRRTALSMVETSNSLDEALIKWGGDQKPKIISTHARSVDGKNPVTFADLRSLKEKNPTEKYFLLFGTGFGMTDEYMKQCDYLLEPIRGSSKDDYRHLSVRSAVSIILDRLLGHC